MERTEALIGAGTDVIVVDIAHGHSENAINTVKNIKKAFSDCEIIAGNVATANGAEDLIKAGVDAGVIHGAVNLVIVEPYLDEAIGIENQALFASGEAEDTPQFWVEYNSYRDWQKSGQLLAGGILGMSIGALFGIVFAYSRNSLPKGHTVKKTFVLAAIMWVTIFLIPFLKYPANPPTVGDTDTVVLRAILYLSFIAISGFSAVAFSRLYKKLENNKYLAFVGYAIFITAVFFSLK